MKVKVPQGLDLKTIEYLASIGVEPGVVYEASSDARYLAFWLFVPGYSNRYCLFEDCCHLDGGDWVIVER